MNKYSWKLTDEDYEFIKGEVCYMFEKYNVKCIPISGFEIAAKMKVTVIAYSGLSKKKLRCALFTSQDGFHIENNGCEYIYYNDIGKQYERQNWTILHEIGHIVLDHFSGSEYEEDEADFFAKYAIAPPILIEKIGADSPEAVYDAFDKGKRKAPYAAGTAIWCCSSTETRT